MRTNRHTEWQADESPDGRTLAFLSNQDGPEALWLLERATGALRARVRHGRRSILGDPHWSRDGKRIVFSSCWDRSRILEHDLATGEERVLVDWPALSYDPVYSPDGSEIAFASTVGGGRVRDLPPASRGRPGLARDLRRRRRTLPGLSPAAALRHPPGRGRSCGGGLR